MTVAAGTNSRSSSSRFGSTSKFKPVIPVTLPPGRFRLATNPAATGSVLVPTATIIAALINPASPTAEALTSDLHSAARTLGLQLQVLHASTEREIDTAFRTLTQLRAGGLVIGSDGFFNSRSEQLGALTVGHAMPAIYQYRAFAAAGGLMSYGGSITDWYRLAGVYTGRILKGEKPADLPVQQSTKVELIINLKTAQALNITFPFPLLGRADEVIE